jgi:hypothetical protein
LKAKGQNLSNQVTQSYLSLGKGKGERGVAEFGAVF